MLVRLRSTTIGLLGLVTFVGLALIAFVSQIGWPSVLSGPLPVAPAPGVVQNDTIALVQAETHPLLATRGGAGQRLQTTANRHGETASSVESDVADADQLTEAPAEHPALPGPSNPPPQTEPAPISRPTGQEPPASAPAFGEDEDGAPAPVAAGADGKSRGRDKEKARERDDRRGDSGDRREDRRGDSDDDEDERSSPEDRWDGDDDWDEDEWDDDHDDDHDHDDWHRGKSDGRRD